MVYNLVLVVTTETRAILEANFTASKACGKSKVFNVDIFLYLFL